MNKEKALKRLTKAVVIESRKSLSDLWDLSWNPDAHVNITLTIEEVRCAQLLFNSKKTPRWFTHPTKFKVQ